MGTVVPTSARASTCARMTAAVISAGSCCSTTSAQTSTGSSAFANSRVWRTLAGAGKVLSMDNTFPAPANVRQTRELAKADDPVEVWAEVVEQHEPAEITAAVIRAHVDARAEVGTTVPIDDPPFVVPEAELAAITQTVRVAVTAGATSGECYTAYQAGFSRS